MTTMSGGQLARVGFAAQKLSRSVTSVHIRRSIGGDEQYDSDSEMTSSRAVRRGKRRGHGRASSLSATQPHRRQDAVPIPEPEQEEEEEADSDEGEEDTDEDDEEEDGESSESSDSSSSSDSSDSSDEEEEEKETQPTPGTGSPSSAPGFQTLVPGAQPPEEQLPSTSEGAPGQSQPLPTLTTTTRPTDATTVSQPTDTLTNEGPFPDSDATSSGILEITATNANGGASSSATGEPTTEDAASASQINGSGSQGPRGADIGIVIGTLAIAALLIAAGIFFYRKRRQSNMDHLERLPDEKSLPPEPPTFRLSAPPPPPPAMARGLLRTQSSIMDEAMGAAYQNEFNETYGERNHLSQDFAQAAYRYDQNSRSLMTAVPARAPISPLANNLSPEWQPTSPRTQLQQQQQPTQPMANFQLFPATNPPPMVPPPPSARFNQVAPPGTLRFQQGLRNSFAQTETTEGEGTWSTFAPERMRANGGRLPLKERVMGHF